MSKQEVYVNQKFIDYTPTGLEEARDSYGCIPVGELLEVSRRLAMTEQESGKSKAYSVSNEKVLYLWTFLYLQYSMDSNKTWNFFPAYFVDPKNGHSHIFKDKKKVSGARRRLEQIGVFEDVGNNHLVFHRDCRFKKDEFDKSINGDESYEVEITGCGSITEQDIKQIKEIEDSQNVCNGSDTLECTYDTREEKLTYINTNFSQKLHYVNGGFDAITNDIMIASNGRTKRVADFTDEEVQALFDIVKAR